MPHLFVPNFLISHVVPFDDQDPLDLEALSPFLISNRCVPGFESPESCIYCRGCVYIIIGSDTFLLLENCLVIPIRELAFWIHALISTPSFNSVVIIGIE